MLGGKLNMARVKEAATVDLYEVGNEPEYFISSLVKSETMSNGLIRLYLGSTRGDHARLEYTVVVSPSDLILMAKECIDIATAAHNDLTTQGKPN
jgi:hypothetical protein